MVRTEIVFDFVGHVDSLYFFLSDVRGPALDEICKRAPAPQPPRCVAFRVDDLRRVVEDLARV
jgi:hypothetical protein